MKRYRKLFEDENCDCDKDEECPCQEGCSKKECMCETCPEGSKPQGGSCIGKNGLRLQGKCDKGFIWDPHKSKCISHT